MGKTCIEVCLISARRLRRTSSLFKFQWFAFGWIDPDNKYCTNIDYSRNANPVWKTKFSTLIDPRTDECKFQDLALHVEVYSRDPLFLRKSLLGSATVGLKESLDKYDHALEPVVEQLGSFQLRKKNSNKASGFVDVMIRISEERGDEDPMALLYLGGAEGFNLMNDKGGINLANGYGPPQPLLLPTTSHQPQDNHSMLFPPNYPPFSGSQYPAATGPSQYYPSRTPPPPPPPPPSNVGYIPNFFPMNTNYPHSSYISMPSSVAPQGGRGGRPGFGMGVGAGALAAGAVIFSDDFMSGFDVPSGDTSVTISTYDPPF